MTLIQNFWTEKVALDQANLEIIQANARRVHNHGIELLGLHTDLIFQDFLQKLSVRAQKQTAEHLSALTELSKTADLKSDNFSLETLGKLEILYQDISTLQITECLEQSFCLTNIK
jgi:hypothetical protein